MKKFAYILVAALAFAACQKEESQKDILVDEGLNTFTFTASVDNNVVDAETKATLSRGGVFSWAESDALKFYDTDGNAYDAVITAVDGEGVATIEVKAAGNPTFYSAIYPAAVADGKNKVNIDAALAKGPVVVAEVGSGSLTFHHIGSIINIKINDIPAETTKMEIAPAAPAEWNAGIFSFTAGVPDFSGNGGFCYPVVPVTSADSGVDISVPIFAANYAGGFTIKLLNDAGRILYKKTTTKNYDLTGTKLLNMKALTYVAPSKYYVKTESSSGYWDSVDVRMIQTGANTFDLSLNCDGNSTYYIYDEYNTDAPTLGYLATGLAKSSFSTGASSIELQGYVNSTGTTWNTVALQYEGDWHYAKNIMFHNVRNDGSYNYTEILFKNGSDYWKSVDLFADGNEYQTKNDDDWNIYVKGIDDSTEYDIFFNINTHKVILSPSSENTDPNQASGIWKLSFNNSTGEATHTWKSATKDNPFGDASFPKTNYGFKSSDDSWAAVVNGSTTYANQSWIVGGITISNAGSTTFGLCDGSSNYWTDLSSDSSFDTVNPGTNLYGTLTYWRDGSHSNPTVTLEKADYIIYVNINPDVNGGVNIMFEKQ